MVAWNGNSARAAAAARAAAKVRSWRSSSAPSAAQAAGGARSQSSAAASAARRSRGGGECRPSASDIATAEKVAAEKRAAAAAENKRDSHGNYARTSSESQGKVSYSSSTRRMLTKEEVMRRIPTKEQSAGVGILDAALLGIGLIPGGLFVKGANVISKAGTISKPVTEIAKQGAHKAGQIITPKLTTPLIKGEGKIVQQIGKHSTPLNIGLNSAAGHSIASTSVGVGKKFAESLGAGTIAKQGAGTIPLTKSVKAIVNTIPKPVTKIAKQGAQTAGGLLGFGTLGNIGADTPITEKTTEFSGSLRQISNDLIHSGDPGKVVAGVVSAPVLGIVSGGAGLAGGIPAAGKGILDIATGKNTKTITTAAADTVTGFIDYVGQGAQQNPLFLTGEIAGFSKGYKGVAKTPGNIIKTVETKIGLIDTRIVNTGDTKIVPAQNPLLSSAISGGAVNAEGMLRLDTAPRATISQKGINLYDNKGSLIKIKNKSGEVIAALGKSHPLSKEGGLDLQRSAGDYPYHTKGQIDKIPFVYGTSSMNEAGTVLGLLDKTGVATVNKIASSVVYATVPLSITTHRGNVVKYKMSDKVITGKDGKTQSVNQYIPNQMTETYKMRNTGEINKNTETFKEAYQENQGLYPITAPKKFNTEWNIQNESEFAWTTKDGADPIFKTAKFGGFTTEGNTILKLGSNDSLIKTLNENRKANKDRVKNPAVRSKSNTEVLDLRNAQADVVRFFARDVSFRLAETVGKPEIKSDITKHGAEHVEDVAGLAKILKDLQGEKFSKISDKEIYYAGILHDAAKNTAAENVPGGHGEMVGSVIRSGASLDARTYMKPEAIKEFESILGKEGTEKYNNFLSGWNKLSDAQKKNVANAVTQHTSNLSLKYSGMMKPLENVRSQTHRLTANKLGMLISDADRITLTERYGSKVKPSKMFVSKDMYDKAIELYYGKKSTPINKPDISKQDFRLRISTGKPPKQPSIRVIDEYNYRKSTPKNKTAPYSGYKSTQKGYKITPLNYKPNNNGYKVSSPDYKQLL